MGHCELLEMKIFDYIVIPVCITIYSNFKYKAMRVQK